MTIFSYSLDSSKSKHGISRVPMLADPVLLALIVLAFLSGCDSGVHETPITARQDLFAPPKFRDETFIRGLAFSHLQGGERLTGVHETLGSGACAFDYDRDGWIDLLLVNGSGLTRYYGQQHWWSLERGHVLFRNEGGYFRDVTAEAGLDVIDWGMACATGDLDNDGYPDLFLANYGANRVYRNNGDGTFTEMTKAAGIHGSEWSTGAIFGDFDGDGYADIYVVNYIDFSPGARTFEDGQQFQRDMARSFDPSFFTSVGNRLYRNRGDWTFEDVTRRAGVADAGGRGLMAQWLDINKDGNLDLLVSNDTASPLGFYMNAGDGTFSAAGERFELNAAAGGRGMALDDVNRDGEIDIVVGTGDGRPPAILVQRPGESDANLFQDAAWQQLSQAGPAATGSTYGIAYEDFNNDGFADLLFANGFIGPDQDVARLPQGQRSTLLPGNPSGFVPHTAFEDAGIQSARSVVVADFDNDGRPDIYIAYNNDVGRLLMNRSIDSGHWISVELKDSRPVTGAVVTVQSSHGQRARVYGAATLLGGMQERLHFGLGEAEAATVSVQWPDGKKTSYRHMKVDQHYLVSRTSLVPIRLMQPEQLEKSFPLVIGARRPAYRIDYLGWRLAKGGPEERRAVFQAALADSHPEVRYAALRMASARKDTEWLADILDVLDHDDVHMRILALAAIEAFEAETTVRWVLAKLKDKAPVVRRRAASVLKTWLASDEAVLQRKFLAVPALIHLLNDSDLETRVVAIEALGESERYRALRPLVSLLTDDSEIVRSAAVRAIGRIREREAIPVVRRILLDDNETPRVRAAAVIALQRLNETGALETLSETKSSAETTLAIVNSLLNSEDRAAIARPRITRILSELASQELTVELHDEFINAICINADTGSVQLIEAYLASEVPQTRRMAWDCIFRLGKLSASDLQTVASTHPDQAVKRDAFRRYLQSASPGREKLSSFSDDPALQVFALEQRVRESDAEAALRLLQLASSTANTTQLEALRNAFRNMRTGHPGAAVYLAHEDEFVRAAALTLWAGSMPAFIRGNHLPAEIETACKDMSLHVRQAAAEILLSRQEAWAARELQRMSSGNDVALRRYLIDNAWMRPGDTGTEILRKVLLKPNDPLHPAAGTALARIATQSALELMLQVMLDENRPADLRFMAARHLWMSTSQHDALIRNTLEGMHE